VKATSAATPMQETVTPANAIAVLDGSDAMPIPTAVSTTCAAAHASTDAWSGQPIPVEYLKNRTPLEHQGALVFQSKQCHNCHSLGGEGGKRGPDLDQVAVRLTPDQLVRQVIQGGGNMPAYGKNLSPAETAALVKFLETLHPDGQAPAQDASRAIAETDQH